MNIRSIMIAGFMALLVSASIMVYLTRQRAPELPVYADVASFEMTERSGRSFGVSELKGKVSVVNFFFTSCTGPCPAMNGKVAELYRRFQGSKRVQFVSVSIDPERDSLTALQDYAKTFGVTDDRWLFLRGESTKVQYLAEKVFMVGGDSPTVHSTKLILVDSNGRIRGYYSSEENESLELLAKELESLSQGSGS